jgi:hypothetical protein
MKTGRRQCPYMLQWVIKTCCASLHWDCKDYIPSTFQIESYCLKEFEKCPFYKYAEEIKRKKSGLQAKDDL